MNFVKEMKVGNVVLSWGVNKVVGKGTGKEGWGMKANVVA